MAVLVQFTSAMLLVSKILVSTLALIPLFAFAQMISDPELPKVVPIKYSQEYNTNAIKEIWGKDASVGLSIARCESGYNNLAVNYTDSKLNGHVSRGLFQMSEINGVIPLWWEPKINAEKAYLLYQKSGVFPWMNCSRSLGLL